jgi:hypothetical protein
MIKFADKAYERTGMIYPLFFWLIYREELVQRSPTVCLVCVITETPRKGPYVPSWELKGK